MTIKRNIDIARLTTFGIHAKAAAVVTYSSLEELEQIIADKSLPTPIVHIGEGSNLLFTDDFPGTLLINEGDSVEFIGLDDNEILVTADAGIPMDLLCGFAAEFDFWGIENLSGIPGSVGAAVVQNVGAYGVEFKDVFVEVDAIEVATSKHRKFTLDEMNYGYRYSLFKSQEWKGRYFIYRVKFRLSEVPNPKLDYGNLRSSVGESPTLAEIRKAIIVMRDSKLPNPSEYGSAGSFFKNPVVSHSEFERIVAENPELEIPSYPAPDGIKIPAAFLIDKCGLKGHQLGNASVWHKQPLVIVNHTGNATGSEILALERLIVATVEKRFGITLHPEVEHI